MPIPLKASPSDVHAKSYSHHYRRGGGWWNLSPEFLICWSISKRFCLQWKAFDLLNKKRYISWVVALLESCDVTKRGRHLGCHLGFSQELEVKPAPNISGFIAQLVRASHRYREVTGSNTDEVGKFFSGFLRNCNCINCVHNSEDHSSLDFMIYFIYIYHNVSSVCKASLLFLTTDLFIECYYVFLYLYICCKWKERKTVKP